MRLTWRDGATTILAGAAVAITIAVTQEWDWPLLGSVTAGVVVLGAVGWAMCILGGTSTTEWSMKNPFTVTMAVLGSAALVLIVIGLFSGSETVFVSLAVVTVVMWMASTTAHAIRRQPAMPEQRTSRRSATRSGRGRLRAITRGGDDAPPHRLLGDDEARTEVDDDELCDLRQHERAGELYIESMDGQRMPRIWDHALSDWVLATQEDRVFVG